MTRPRRPAARTPTRGVTAGRVRPGGTTGSRLPRRPRAGGSRSSAGDAPVAGSTSGRAAPAGSPFTTRAAILALVVGTLVFSGVLPVREYLRQRADISSVVAQQAAANARVAALEQQERELQDPAYVTAEARRRLHMAMPGDITYLVAGTDAAGATRDPAGAAAPAAQASGAQPSGAQPSGAQASGAQPATPSAPAESPWWSQLWAGVRADDAPPAPHPAR